MDDRLDALQRWLRDDLDMQCENLRPASADASFRRYFRVQCGQQSFVVMDAPPQQEPLQQFIAVDQALIRHGVHAPRIHARNERQGFLLLEDLGDELYLDYLPDRPKPLYNDALVALLKIQAATIADDNLELPSYDADRLGYEMDLFRDWYVARHLQQPMDRPQQQLWADTKQSLIDACVQQPQVWVHRDYHSRNLMVTKQNSPGVIDFQDMMIGPLAYDLASLFKDCYLRWPRDTQLDWLRVYMGGAAEQLPDVKLDFDNLVEWFDLTALQRHLKVLGIFCRLHYRDGKDRYLEDLPLVRSYVDEALDLYPQFDDFRMYFNMLNKLPDA
ncbi:MAG: phosphotransferase [Arenicella sp.]|nr:phosphotransferase [Arenicella sp.]